MLIGHKIKLWKRIVKKRVDNQQAVVCHHAEKESYSFQSADSEGQKMLHCVLVGLEKALWCFTST